MHPNLLKIAFCILGFFAPALAARVGVRLFYTPRRRQPSEWETQLQNSGAAFAASGAEFPLQAISWGSGPLVLLVHGWEGRGTQLGRFVMPLVDAGFRVVAFDGPAHGRSPGRPTTLPEFAAAIVALCRELGPLYGIVGHSFGAAAASIALQNGISAEKAVFVSPPFSFANVVGRFASFLSIPENVVRRMHVLMEKRHRCPPGTLSFDTIGPQMRAPALIFHDADDRYVPHHDGLAVAGAWQGSTMVTTTGLGYNRILRDGVVIERVVEFMGRDESVR
ncbi:MAG: alpha/beta hydrolase [Gammaproteobacteria bacterium]|nr:alpha/beta hydrolase [Gammaproteobacteria bacterium]